MKKLFLIFVFALTAVNMMAQDKIVFTADQVCLRYYANEQPGSKWTGSGAPQFNYGDKLPCTGETGNYYKVKYNGKDYYVPTKYATKDNGVEGAIVNVTRQLYPYQDMLEDLNLLQQKYPDFLSFQLEGETYQGRKIPVVTLGNPKARKFVMVQAAMHAREYLSAQLVMAMIEHYASNYQNGRYKETDLKEIFNNVCFIIMPMVNPDGVEIAQRGEDGAVTPDVKEWVRQNTQRGNRFNQIKSNARGVDINRNFRSGFGRDRNRKTQKGYSHYPGTEPYSEVETNMLLEISKRHDYTLFLNYHTSGNLVYYGSGTATNSANAAALKVSRIINRHANFPLHSSSSYSPIGSWANEVGAIFNRPSVTIELGTKNPVPIAEFNGLYNKNKWVWADVALAIMNGEL